MIPANAEPLLLAQQESGGYQISRSLRFNAADTPSLSRTVASAGNRKTWTWAGWVKRSAFAADSGFFASGSNANNYVAIRFTTANNIEVFEGVAGAATTLKLTAAVYRDPSAWMHVVLAVDTTQATGTNRVKLYANGAAIIEMAVTNDPTLNQDLQANQAGTMYAGIGFASNPFAGYLADVHFIDGQALTPSSFGEFDTNNVWQPKAFTGSYGTNGFRLDFSDNSAATATTLGADRSGNGNNFTPSNLSVTAGVGNDSLTDTPTNYGTDTGLGGEVRGNYCTWNPTWQSGTYPGYGTAALSDGNLRAALPANNDFAISTLGVSTGKWYWEMRYENSTSGAGCYLTDPTLAQSSSVFTAWPALNTDVGFRYDADANVFEYTTNGTSWTAISTSSLTNKPVHVSAYATAISTKTAIVNFGQRPFTYTAPAGYKALCSTNLPTPTIANGATAMDTVLYTGTGAQQFPFGSVLFSPGLVWIKSRSAATDHAVYDVVRGNQIRLETNTADGEVSSDLGFSFPSTVGTLAQINTNGATYAGWCWNAGASTVTNTAGSISSQVRANTTAGISVVTYTGTSANATVGHGLGVAPQLVIVKQRRSGSGTGWAVWHTSIANTNYLLLNTTDISATSATYWNSTSPTSSVFSLGSSTVTNPSFNMVAYLFAPVSGFSAFGSYTGNLNADGPFVYTGFRPRWILTKATTGTQNWTIHDSSRTEYNVGGFGIFANGAGVESGTGNLDILSNGFKLRVATGTVNPSSGTMIYAAFAEHPFSLARAR